MDQTVESKWIVARLYHKLHARKEGSGVSSCGRADVTKPAFTVYAMVPREPGAVRSLCGKCFPGETVESFMARV